VFGEGISSVVDDSLGSGAPGVVASGGGAVTVAADGRFRAGRATFGRDVAFLAGLARSSWWRWRREGVFGFGADGVSVCEVDGGAEDVGGCGGCCSGEVS